MDIGSSSSDVSNVPGYKNEDLIIGVISKIDDGNGVDIDGIFKFCEKNYAIPEGYMKALDEDLKILVSQNKLEKVETRYKILDATVTQATKELLEKTEAAAKALAEAESKELEAKEAAEFAEKTKKLLEESDLMVQIAQEVADRCAKGETVLLP